MNKLLNMANYFNKIEEKEKAYKGGDLDRLQDNSTFSNWTGWGWPPGTSI